MCSVSPSCRTYECVTSTCHRVAINSNRHTATTFCNGRRGLEVAFQTLQRWRRCVCNTLQHTATYRNTCNTLQHTATHCNTLQRTERRQSGSPNSLALEKVCLQHSATHRNTIQHAATHCNTMQRTGKPQSGSPNSPALETVCLQHTATHCNTLQHAATYCNTIQHTATHCNGRRGDKVALQTL